MTDEQLIELILQSENPRRVIREAARRLRRNKGRQRQSMCQRGLHELSDDNAYENTITGSRQCRKCKRMRERPEWKAGGKRSTERVTLNSTLREKSTRHGYVWTGPELELAAREDLTAKQVAEMLGRTIFSVKTARHKLRHDPGREVLLAGVRK